jgi:hypothetical protein
MPAFIVIAPSMDAIAHFQKSLKGPYLMDQLLNFHPDLNQPQTDKRNKIYYAIANPTSPEEVMKLHESLLTDEEKLKIYKTLNESIKKMYHFE